MAVGVPTSITTAALAMLGIIGAIATYIASNYQDLTAFYILISTSAIALIWGVWQGVRGITELTNKGFEGEWLVETKKHRFNKQAGATLLGLIVLGVAVIVGFTAPSKPSKPTNVQVTVAGNISLRARLAEDEVKISRVETTLTSVVRELRRVRHPVDRGPD
jgi:hypothetical protein